MIILLFLLILWTPYVVSTMLRAQQNRSPIHIDLQTVPAYQGQAETDLDLRSGAAWSALDDHQLTRLLTDSSPRTPTE